MQIDSVIKPVDSCRCFSQDHIRRGEQMLSREKALWIFRKMTEIRTFEETAWKLYSENRVYGSVHLYIGEEAIAASVCSYMDEEDKITSTHRGHGHCIAKGGTLKQTLCEMMGREEGYCRGRGGSMHIADFAGGNLGANGTVGAGVPIAIGAALAQKYKGKKHFTAAFFGDGAANQGGVHESMNLASIWKLPVLFVCENNQYALSTSAAYSVNIENLSDRAKAYGIPGYTVDGNDVVSICDLMDKIVPYMLDGNGPVLLECKTGRWMGHWTGDPQNYRNKDEVEYWKERCPIKRFGEYMKNNALACEEELDEITLQVRNEMDEAVEYASACAFPDPAKVQEGVFCEEGGIQA